MDLRACMYRRKNAGQPEAQEISAVLTSAEMTDPTKEIVDSVASEPITNFHQAEEFVYQDVVGD